MSVIKPLVPELFHSAFTSLEASLIKSGTPSDLEMRKQALAAFHEVGIPSSRLEEWKYTNLSRFSFDSFQLPPKNSTKKVHLELPLELIKADPAQCWHFYNGECLQRPTSDSFIIENSGALLAGYPNKRENVNRFQLLNQAFGHEGAHLVLPKGCHLEEPIYIVHLSHSTETPLMVHPKNTIIAKENSRATLIEIYLTLDGALTFSNATTHIQLEKGAHISHYFLQRSLTESVQISDITVQQAASSDYRGIAMLTGGGANRATFQVDLNGPEANCHFKTLELAEKQQKTDIFFTVSHHQPSTSSNILARSIVKDSARSAFTGKIIVKPGAIATQASLENKNLLLSPTAEAMTRPLLEIYADDIQCRHGATVGFLDEEALFYLKSRGIPDHEARQLLIESFISPCIQDIPGPLLSLVQEVIHGY